MKDVLLRYISELERGLKNSKKVLALGEELPDLVKYTEVATNDPKV